MNEKTMTVSMKSSNLRTRVTGWGILLFLVVFQVMLTAQTTTEPANDKVRHLKTDNGIEFGLWGGNGEKKPAPVLFILASTIDETLGVEYFRQCGNRLAKEHGWLCVSLDLPYHGKLQKDSVIKNLVGWADAMKRGEDFITANNKRMRDILDYLIRKGYADASNVYACGSSRGGYLALQFAAFEPRVRSVAAFGPVSDLLAVREFAALDRKSLLPIFSFDTHLDSLAKRDVWMVIGDRDERVGTDLCMELARKITRAGLAAQSNKKVELNVMWEPKGHTTPKGAVDRAADWLYERYSER